MMKYKTLIAACALAAAGFAVAAQAPEIERGRIDSMVAQVLQQADADPHAAHRPDGAAIRKEVTTQLQSFEVLKNAALKAGLDKDPEVQNQLKNLEAQFYASQYAAYLERNAEVSEADVRAAYDQQTRVIKLQQVQFDSPEAARAAQELLLKGMTFDELMKRYPNPEQQFTDFVSPQQLPPELAQIAGQMTRGQITRDPLPLNGKFYLFKLAAAERNPEAPPFDAVKRQLTQQAKQQKAQAQIEQLLQDNGIR
ncbi:peptidyl-prolyl cis-trans isomerase [Uruburuella testudinis]|uniref:peptidylprolyl isomerase n=1 Tax=Uruburuella testudinis TaxID=1282863 RepID=A0ABY4DU27_9NEIS|nr:peptidyl-prolyl cis-trans isomerase [Uruburuella testudinis]UOO81519.1 peptidyl-prolyl cis-trans isomerase [Uruburuella testudinis]